MLGDLLDLIKLLEWGDTESTRKEKDIPVEGESVGIGKPLLVVTSHWAMTLGLYHGRSILTLGNISKTVFSLTKSRLTG